MRRSKRGRFSVSLAQRNFLFVHSIRLPGQILNKVTGAYKFYALPAAQVNQPLDVPSIPVIPLPSDPGTVAQPSPFPTALPDFLTPSTGFITVADPVGSPLAQVFPGTQPQNGLTQCGCVTAGTCVTVRRASGVIDTRIVTQVKYLKKN